MSIILFAVHQRYVLTAAHCVASDSDHADGGAFYILVGDHDITTGDDSKYSKLYYVEEVRRHEDFDRAGFDNDIALLRTTEDIIWSRAVGPACLPFRFLYVQFIRHNLPSLLHLKCLPSSLHFASFHATHNFTTERPLL